MYINVRLSQANRVVLDKIFILNSVENINQFIEHTRKIYFPYAEATWNEVKEVDVDYRKLIL